MPRLQSIARLVGLAAFYSGPPILVLRWITIRMGTETAKVDWNTVIVVGFGLVSMASLFLLVASEWSARRGSLFASLGLAGTSGIVASYFYGPLLWSPRVQSGQGALAEMLPSLSLGGVYYLTGSLFLIAVWVTIAQGRKSHPN